MSDKIVYWMGRPVTDMTREQLVKVVGELAEMVESERERAQHAWSLMLVAR